MEEIVKLFRGSHFYLRWTVSKHGDRRETFTELTITVWYGKWWFVSWWYIFDSHIHLLKYDQFTYQKWNHGFHSCMHSVPTIHFNTKYKGMCSWNKKNGYWTQRITGFSLRNWQRKSRYIRWESVHFSCSVRIYHIWKGICFCIQYFILSKRNIEESHNHFDLGHLSL